MDYQAVNGDAIAKLRVMVRIGISVKAALYDLSILTH